MKRVLAVLLATVVLLYGADYVRIRENVRKNNDPYGTVQVISYSTVPEKNNKMEFFYGEPDTEQCVHSLFPHFDKSPCWYTGKSREERTDL